jgi:PKD domain
VVDSPLDTEATIGMTTRSRGFIRICAGTPGWSLALGLAALALVCAPAAAAPEPFFTVSPESPLTNEVTTFTSTQSDPPDAQTWDLDGDRVCDDATGASAQRSFPAAGNYRVTLCIQGGDFTNTRTITVRDQTPAAAFTFAPATPLTGERVLLASTSADPDGVIAGQAWDLDADGAFDDASGPTAEWSFADPGDHMVRLQVTDNNGVSAVAALTVPVAERPAELLSPFPVVRVTASFSERGTRFRALVVHAPDGARVIVGCRGRHCPFDSFVRKADVQARSARTVRIRRLARYVLRPGTLIEIRVIKRGEVGKYTRFRIRKGKPPVRVDRCLQPGSRRPERCPST